MHNRKAAIDEIVTRLQTIANVEFKRGEDVGDYTQGIKLAVLFNDGEVVQSDRQLGSEVYFNTNRCPIVCASINDDADEAFAAVGQLVEDVKTAMNIDDHLSGKCDVFYFANFETEGGREDRVEVYEASMSFDVIFEYTSNSIM